MPIVNAALNLLTALVNAVENQCPVLDMLTRNVNVEGVAIANGKEIQT